MTSSATRLGECWDEIGPANYVEDVPAQRTELEKANFSGVNWRRRLSLTNPSPAQPGTEISTL